MDINKPVRQSRPPKLSIEELHTKTAWIRDVLEPDIAQHGPDHLLPDIILELASFFSQLLAYTSTTTPSVQRITFSDIQASRIHRALLIITGKGTRWPMKLIEVGDTLVKAWTERFGNLNTLRPLLYEKGGRLHKVKEEKDMGRHALLVKWLSDQNTLVSPLRALEWGHLDFTPGKWWIHPIFAFYDGVVDSPDPQGGITADSEGAYAVMLTGDDEIESLDADSFTYRVRKDDKNKYRLLQTLLPPRHPVRVLRSHTLQSLWSPIAGLRYEGLFWVAGYKVKTDRKGEVCFQVRLERDSDQISMIVVQRHPTAAEVDDYVEYKRLRYHRLKRARDLSKRVPKSDQILGVVQPLQDPEPDTEVERELEDLNRGRRGAIVSEDRTSLTEEQIRRMVDQASHDPMRAAVVEQAMRSVPLLDGSSTAGCSNPIAHAFPSPLVDQMEFQATQFCTAREPAGPIHDCSADEGPNSPTHCAIHELDCNTTTENTIEQCMYELSANLRNEQDKLSISHTQLRTLKNNLFALLAVTWNRGAVSQKFYQDLVGILKMVEKLENDMMAKEGCVDQCVWDLARELTNLALKMTISDLVSNKRNEIQQCPESPTKQLPE